MNFVRAVQALVDANVNFVIGGWCAILHGSSYTTNDLDLFFARDKENCKRIAQALAPFHPRLRNLAADLRFIWEDTTLGNGAIFTLSTDLGPIDLLAEVTGLGSFAEVKRLSILISALDREVWTLDLPGLIRAKRAAGWKQDLQLIPELESLPDAGERG